MRGVQAQALAQREACWHTRGMGLHLLLAQEAARAHRGHEGLHARLLMVRRRVPRLLIGRNQLVH
jgi:hypothetical protein